MHQATFLEGILKEITSGQRSDAHKSPPNGKNSIPTYRDFREDMVRGELVRGTLIEPHKALIVGESSGGRIPLVTIPATSGSGKSHLLQQVARIGNIRFDG